MASCVKEDIFWLQVAVNDPLQRKHAIKLNTLALHICH